jgi:hypothetical protein
MMTRLGFALVTALDPDVLLMDEGFGAADLRFAERSAERMDEFIGRSRIMVIASHSDAMITSICNKAAWLNEGRLMKIGPVEEIFDKYHESVHRNKMQKTDTGKSKGGTVPATPAPLYSEKSIRDVGVEDRRMRTMGEVIFTRLVAKDSIGRTRWDYRHGESVSFHIEYEAIKSVRDLIFLLRLYLPEDASTGKPTQIISDINEVVSTERIEAGQHGTIEITISHLPFTSNEFSIYGWIGRCDRSRCYDVVDENVALPRLQIKSDQGTMNGIGIVSLDYSIHKTKSKPASAEGTPQLRA